MNFEGITNKKSKQLLISCKRFVSCGWSNGGRAVIRNELKNEDFRVEIHEEQNQTKYNVGTENVRNIIFKSLVFKIFIPWAGCDDNTSKSSIYF